MTTRKTMATYSQYWRRNVSRHPSTELGLSLRALRKVAGHLGRNVKPVFWKGMQAQDSSAIILHPDGVEQTCPIPPERFDLLVAQVVHEGLSSIEWSEWVTSKVQQQATGLPEEALPFLKAFLRAAEDIYVSELAKPCVWSLYLSKLWSKERTVLDRDPRLPPSAESLTRVWKRYELTGHLSDKLHHDYLDPLRRLTDCARAIRSVVLLPSPAQRRENRVHLYLETWSSLYRILTEWETFGSSPDAINLFDEAAPKGPLPRPQGEEKDRSEDQGEEGNDSLGLEPSLAEEVQNLVEETRTDLTRRVLVAVEDPEAGSMRTHVKQGTARMAVRSDPFLVKQLQKIFREQESLVRRARRRRVRRGVIEGKLDARRLHRVPIDGKVFKNREPPGSEHIWHICLVADASASMTGKGARQKPWPIAERALASLAEASKGSRNRVDLYAYQEQRNRCTLTQLYHDGELYTVIPSGRTPSGQAILAAAMIQKESRSRSMIIHITDGASNCGVRLSDAVAYCTRNAIDLYTIGCGCSQQTKDFLGECFPPSHLYFMQTIRTLPLVLQGLLRQRILHAIR